MATAPPKDAVGTEIKKSDKVWYHDAAHQVIEWPEDNPSLVLIAPIHALEVRFYAFAQDLTVDSAKPEQPTTPTTKPVTSESSPEDPDEQ